MSTTDTGSAALIVPGTLTGQATIFQGLATFAPVNQEEPSSPGYIASRPAATIDRGNIDRTLNFLIPANWCSGKMPIEINVRLASADQPSAYTLIYAEFQSVPDPKVHAVLVNYTGQDVLGQNLNIPSPTSTDFINTLNTARGPYPVSSFNITGFSTIQFSGNLNTSLGGGCGQGWNALLSTISAMRTASSSSDVYVALLPSSNRIPSVAGGCAYVGGPEAATFAGSVYGICQELAHTFGRLHAPCGPAANVDPNYPQYGSYPSGSIGEYGFDVGGLRVLDPPTYSDFMTYCPAKIWTSPYTYMGLLNAMAPRAAAEGARFFETMPNIGEHLHIAFTIDRNGQVEITSGFHLPDLSVERSRLSSPLSPLLCELRSESGKVLASVACDVSAPNEPPHSPVLARIVTIPWSPDAQEIAFVRDGKELSKLSIEKQPPTLGKPRTVQAARDESLLRLEWEASHPDHPLRFLVRYSHDDGRTWRALAANLTLPSYDVPAHVSSWFSLTRQRTIKGEFRSRPPGSFRSRFKYSATAGLRHSRY